MKEKRVTKKAIFASLLSVAVCTSMLIGTSYAWFTDSVTSAGNKIKAGTLQVDLEVKGGNTGYTDYTSVKQSKAPIFNYEKWEPGYTSWTNVRVTNAGNLALKYTLRFTSTEGNLATADLANAIDVYYVAKKEITSDVRPEDLTMGGQLRKIGTLADVFNANEGTVLSDSLLPDDAATEDVNEGQDVATIVLKMQEDAGNEYQGKELPAFDLELIAMQETYESDTFGNDYDANANGIPDHPEWGNLNTTASAVKVAGEDTVIEATGAKVTIPAADTGVAEGERYTFSVEPSDEATITINDGQSKWVYDIDVVTTDDSSLKKVELNIGKDKTGVKTYHGTTLMSAVDATNTENEGFNYDAATGILTIWTKTFSPFTIVNDTVAGMRMATTSSEFTAAVNDADVDTVVMGRNLSYKSFNIDRELTVDMNGYALTSTTVEGGNITFTNGTLKGSQAVNVYSPDAENPTTVTIAEDVVVDGNYSVILRENTDGSSNSVVNLYGETKGNIWIMGGVKSGDSVVNIYGKVNSTKSDVGIAVQGKATVNVKSGAYVESVTGIEVRGGNLNVEEGAVIIGNASPTEVTPNGNGTTTTGAGIAVAKHTTDNTVTVNIAGGTIKGFTPLYISNPENKTDMDKVTVNVTGGTFECINNGTLKFYVADNCEGINYTNTVAD